MNVGDNLIAASNITITIRCPVSGVPTPAVIWLKEGAPIIEGRDVSTTDDKSLVITRADSDDNGRYSCTAVNVAGMDNSSSDITIIGVCCSCGLEGVKSCHHIGFSQTGRKNSQANLKCERSFPLHEFFLSKLGIRPAPFSFKSLESLYLSIGVLSSVEQVLFLKASLFSLLIRKLSNFFVQAPLNQK